MKFNIMFVEDSINVIESVQWLFMDEPYYLFAFDNPLDALHVINTLEWAVVIAGRSMQNMDGLEFLKKVQGHSPHTMGIIMTGYNEIKEASDVLDQGSDYRFIKKPLNNFEIKQAVKAAIADFEKNTGIKRLSIV